MNTLTQYVFDPLPRVLRQRQGHTNAPKHLAFYDPTNLLTIADNAVRTSNLLNEHQSINFSQKKVTKALRASVYNFDIGRFNAFAFSTTREGDWCNVLTIHKNLPVPILWSYENKRIGARNVEMSHRRGKAKLTACEVSSCGNFGIIGFADGSLEVFNMQSGLS
jgi:U3 small nucleolar RNA-associated protein 21